MKATRRRALAILAAFVVTFGLGCLYFALVQVGVLPVTGIRITQANAWIAALISGAFMVFALTLSILALLRKS